MKTNKKILFIGISLLMIFNLKCDVTKSNDENYDICYCKKIDDNWQIILNNFHGTNEHNISYDKKIDCEDPLWASDGSCIAYKYDDGDHIFLYYLENDSTVNITSGLGDNEYTNPEIWSPDSKKLIYNYHKLGEPYFFYIMNKDGSNKKKLFNKENCKIIDFYYDNESFLYTENYEEICIYNIFTDSKSSILEISKLGDYKITIDDYNSFDNILLYHEDKIINSSHYGSYLKTIDLNTLKIDTLLTTTSNIYALQSSYSNIFDQMVFKEVNYTEDYSLLKTINSNKIVKLDKQKNDRSYSWDKISFSPFNNYLTYVVLEDATDGSEYVSFERLVYVLNIDKKESKLISKGVEPQWNPLADY